MRVTNLHVDKLLLELIHGLIHLLEVADAKVGH